jgi:methyl-accepting chemotaxis protein
MRFLEGRHMKLATKITLSASCGVIFSTLGTITTVDAISHSNRLNELRALMGVCQIAVSLKQMEQITQSAAVSAEQNANSSEKVSSQSGSLDSMVGRSASLIG